MALNARQRRFAELYAEGMSATAAAREAGYSARTAKAQGCRLLTNADVQKNVAELQSKMEAASIADGREVRERITNLLRDEQQKPSIRLKAGSVLLKYDRMGEGGSSTEAAEAEEDEPGDGWPQVMVPWPVGHPDPPNAVKLPDEAGTVVPLAGQEHSDLWLYVPLYYPAEEDFRYKEDPNDGP